MSLRPSAALGLSVVCAIPAVTAQTAYNVTVGRLYQIDPQTSLKVLRCFATQWGEKCMVHFYQGGQRVGNNEVEYWPQDIIKQEKAYWASQGKSPPNSTGQQGVAESCPAPPPAVSNAAPASEAVFKRKIYDNYALSVNGTVSAPRAVGVTFEKFGTGKAVTNRVIVDPATGAHRINDGAPANVLMTPVKSVHVVCEQYTNGVSKRRVASNYFCFKSGGAWTCGGYGVPTITRLD